MAEKCIFDPERDCPGLMKAREIEQDVNELRQQNASTHEKLYDRIRELEKQEGILGVQYNNILEKLGTLTENMSDLKRDTKEVLTQLPSLIQRVEALEKLPDEIDELKAKPAKRWDGMVEKVIWTLVAAVIGCALAKIGLV